MDKNCSVMNDNKLKRGSFGIGWWSCGTRSKNDDVRPSFIYGPSHFNYDPTLRGSLYTVIGWDGGRYSLRRDLSHFTVFVYGLFLGLL